MEGFSGKEKSFGHDSRFRHDIHTKAIRAGQRTYFFDVKITRTDELYMTITESKKHYDNDGKSQYEKHKIFLYREDFEKFLVSLEEVMDYVREQQPIETYNYDDNDELADVTEGKMPGTDFTDVSFEDLSR